MKRRRFLVLYLPRVATDRIRQKEPELAGVPIAAWDTQGNRRLLTSVDAPGTIAVARAGRHAPKARPAARANPHAPCSWATWMVAPRSLPNSAGTAIKT